MIVGPEGWMAERKPQSRKGWVGNAIFKIERRRGDTTDAETNNKSNIV